MVYKEIGPTFVPLRQQNSNIAEYIQNTIEEVIEAGPDLECVSQISRNKSKSDVSIPLLESGINEIQEPASTAFMSKLPRSTSGCSSGDPVQQFRLESDIRKSMPGLSLHHQNSIIVASGDTKKQGCSSVEDHIDGDQLNCGTKPNLQSTGSTPSSKLPTLKSSMSKVKVSCTD
jgi:hypothetical protein